MDGWIKAVPITQESTQHYHEVMSPSLFLDYGKQSSFSQEDVANPFIAKQTHSQRPIIIQEPNPQETPVIVNKAPQGQVLSDSNTKTNV